MTKPKYSFEGFPELWVKYCVDDWINTRIDVAKEGCDVEGDVAGRSVDIVFDTEGIQDIAGEEWDPTGKEAH